MPKAQRPGDDETLPRESPGVEPTDPNERLKQLQTELNQNKSHIEHLNQQADALQTDITDLSANVAEIQTTNSNYAGALPDLESRLQSLQYFFEQKHKMVLAAIGDWKDPINEMIREYDHEIEKMEKRAEELGEKQNAAQKESAEAAKAQARLQKEFDRLNQSQQTVTANLTDMENLRSLITAFDDKSDVASMYFVIHEFQHTLGSTEIISQHKLGLQLRHELARLEAAKENSRALTAAYNTQASEYTAHEAALQTKQQTRRDHLLAAVQAKFPPQPATSATSAAAGSGTPAGVTTGTTTSSPANAQKQ